MSLKKLWEIYCDCNFERAVDRLLYRATELSSGLWNRTYRYGAYHIEYDYLEISDYPTVRAAIAAQNPLLITKERVKQ